MKLFRYLCFSTLFVLLTLITQVGGLVFIVSIWTGSYFNRYFSNKWMLAFCKTLSFLILYFLCVILFVPPLAKLLGRVPLPVYQNPQLRPSNVYTWLLNRHYVRPDLKTAILGASQQFAKKYPEACIYYLDANFPFMDGFPLVPHLSHNDGRKLDLAFCYKDHATGKPSRGAPSFIGYGICEESRQGEVNTAKMCAEKGYWQYSLLRKITPQSIDAHFDFDAESTAGLVQSLSAQKEVSRIFIEPHLVARLKLDRSKIRFHGCHAVRHDDHIHIQVK